MLFNSTKRPGPSLCLVVLANGPKEKPVYLPVCDYLFRQGFTPIEVRSPGEALIHTRQAKFSIIVIPDDDHEVIKKIKSPDGLNHNSIVIAISSADISQASTRELVNQKVIQQIVHKTSNLEEFQNNVIDAIKSQLANAEIKQNEFETNTAFSSIPQGNEFEMLHHTNMGQYNPLASQSEYDYAMPNQPHPYSVNSQPYLTYPMSGQPPNSSTSSQSGDFLPPFPLQPFTLIPPMVVPYSSLMPGNGTILPPESYMMPRIVDFGPTHNKAFPHIGGRPLSLPGFPVSLPAIGNQALRASREPDSTTNYVPITRNTPEIKLQDDEQEKRSKVPLPGISNFLECLSPASNGKSKTGKNEEKNTNDLEGQGNGPESGDESASKRSRMETRRTCHDVEHQIATATSDEEVEVGKNPLSALIQTRPYFMNLDEKMEGIAFDPKVKPSDRHNAKERHRRIRITKAGEFFKKTLPCMDANMDKASTFHVTAYYILFLRQALQQIDPKIIGQLHQTYKDEWKSYFDMSIDIE